MAFIDSPLTPLTTSSIISNITNSLSTTLLTETEIGPVSYLSPIFPKLSRTTLNLNYSTPIIASYNDLNDDYETQQTIIKYIRLKMLDKWLYKDFKDIFGYFVVEGDKVHVSSKYNELAYKNDSDKVLEKKADYIGEKYLTKKMVSKFLYKFVKESGTEWVQIPHSEYYVKKLLVKKLRNMIKGGE